MNKGVNKKSTYFEKQVGSSGTVVSNLNPLEGGMYIKIPIITTEGLEPINLELVFSIFNLNENTYFGKGIRESFYSKCNIAEDESKVYVEDAYGKIWEYDHDFSTYYECKENNTRLECLTENEDGSVYRFYYIYDKYGNMKYIYDEDAFPSEIRYKDGSFYQIIPYSMIYNSKGTKIAFNRQTRVYTVSKNNVETYRIELVLENNFLSKIIYKKAIVSDTETSYEILYTNEYIVDTTNKSITIIDGLSNYRVKFNYIEQDSTYLLTSYLESYSESFNTSNTTTITYNEDYTRVNNHLGEFVDYYFNNNGNLRKQINSLGQIEVYEYDENDYLMIKASNINHTKTYCNKYGIISLYFSDGNPLSYTSMSPTINTFDTFLYKDHVGSKALTISNYSNSSEYYIEKTYNGKVDEYLTLSLWSMNSSVAPVSSLDITLNLINNTDVVETHNFSIDNEDFDFDVYQIKAKNTFTKVKLTFSPTNGGSYHINAVNLIPTASLSYYTYDDKGNLLNSSYMDNSSENIYADNKAIQKYNTYSRLSRFNYNDKNQVTEETSSNGLIKRYSYNEDNQIINETYEFIDKYIKTSNTYENGYVKTTKDNIQSITSYDINNITGITNSVTNSLNEIESYVYNNRDDITELRVSKNNDSKKTEYVYKTYKKVPVIDKVKLENGSVYEYVYDDYERVIGVDYYNINNVTNKKRLITYSYEDKNNFPNSNIKTINKFNSTYTKHYEYDNFNNITRIYYTDYMTGGALATFTYDENKKLIKEVSGNNIYTKNYVYDSNNRLTETNDSNGVKFNYQYSKTNELNVKKQTIDNEVTYFDYDTLHQTRGSDSSAVIAEYETEEDIYTFFYNYFDEDNNRKIELVNFSNNGIKTAKEFVNNNFNVVTENGLSKIDYTQNTGDKLKIKLDIENSVNYSQAIGYWFYPTRDLGEQTLFYTEYDNGLKNKIEVKHKETLINGVRKWAVITTLYIDDYPKQKNIFVCPTLSKNNWHFIYLNLYSYSSLEDEAEVYSYQLYVDGLYDSNIYRSGVTLKQHHNQEMLIGGGKENNDKLVGYIGPIIYTNHWNFEKEDIDKFYLLTKEYIINNSYLEDDLEEDDSEEDVKYYNSTSISRYDLLKTVEIYPLNNGLNSLNGKVPYSFDSRLGMKYEKSSNFKYNSSINKHAYVADGSILKYKFNGGYSGNIRFKFLIEENNYRQYILSFVSGNNERITIYRGNDKLLYMSYNNTSIIDVSLGIIIENDNWYSFGLEYQSYGSNNTKIIIYVNDEVKTYTDSKVLVGGGTITLGISDIDIEIPVDNSNETFKYNFPMFGLIEQLSFGSTNFINGNYKYENDYRVKNYSTHYDEFGLLRKEINRCNENNELEKYYSYIELLDDASKKQVLPLIKEEKIKYNNIEDIYNYTYDALGRIKSIEGNNKYIVYEYNYDGSLNKELHYIGDEEAHSLTTSFRYEYDNNSNITKTYQINSSGAETLLYSYNYDTIYPDRLNSVNWNTFKYDSVNHLYPTAFGVFDSNGNQTSGFTYNFDDTFLTSVSLNGTTYTYTYDNITRLKKTKTTGGITTNFYYDDNNLLVKEVSPIIEKEYIYDINGLVKELVITKDNTKYRYIYLKDILGNIIGLLDENLNKVASYEYYAYGKIKSISTTVTSPFNLSEENPFRYRGYYYDTSIHMYYCHTRYYLPEYGRWLSPDDVNYLEPTNINGMNLYCYCGNDPVNYSDGSGHMPEWVQGTLKVLGAVAIVVGVTALTVVTAGVAAYALGASAAMIGAITTGAAVGGLVAGGLEIGAQIYENGIDGMNLGAIAIESFAGSVYGAISGVASTTTSAALRLGMRGARVALGGLSTALHGINNGDSFGTIMLNVGVSIGTGILIQGAFAGLDAYTGKLSSTILQNYALDGALNFGGNQLLLMSGILLGKNVWRNRGLFI